MELLLIRSVFQKRKYLEKEDAAYTKPLIQSRHITTARNPIEVKAISMFSEKLKVKVFMLVIYLFLIQVRFKRENIWRKKDAAYTKPLIQFNTITTARKPIEVKAISMFSEKLKVKVFMCCDLVVS